MINTIITLYIVFAILTFGITLKNLTTNVKYKTAFKTEYKQKKNLPYILSIITGLIWPIPMCIYIYYFILLTATTFRKIKGDIK